MDNRSGSTDTGHKRATAESVERLHLKLFAQQFSRLLDFENVSVIDDAFRETIHRVGTNQFCRRESSQFVLQRAPVIHFRDPKFAGADIDQSKSETVFYLVDRR